MALQAGARSARRRVNGIFIRYLAAQSKGSKPGDGSKYPGYIHGPKAETPTPESAAHPTVPYPASGAPSGRSAAKLKPVQTPHSPLPPGTDVSWKLHPSLPVDVRLLGAGLAGAAALAYSFSRGDKSQPPAGAAIHPEFADDDDSSGGAGESEEAGIANITVLDSDQSSSEASTDVEMPSDDDAAPSSQAAQQTEQQSEVEQEGERRIVDSHAVLGLIDDVFSKHGDELLKQDEVALRTTTTAPESSASEERARATAHAEQATSVKKGLADYQPPPPPSPQPPEAQPSKREGKDDADLAAAQLAITTAISDTAGDSVASDVGRAPKGVELLKPHARAGASTAVVRSGESTDAAAAAPPSRPPALPLSPKPLSGDLAAAAAALAGVRPAVLKTLGLHADVTAAGLLAEAGRRGKGAGDDWQEYKARHKQAEADAATFAAFLHSADAVVRSQLEAAAAEASAGRSEAAEARRAAAAQTHRYRAALQEALTRAEEQHRRRMRVQAEQLGLAHAEVTVRERAERQAALDELRLKLGALSRALGRRSDLAATSHAAHRLAQGAFALQDALAAGQPLDEAAGYLSQACGDDQLVAAAVRSLPRGAAVPTRAQLEEEYQRAQRAARELSALPSGRGGLLSVAAAKLAAALKAPEREPQAANIAGGGVDKALAAAQARLVAGSLLQAAGELEGATAGTAAAPAVTGWVRRVRERAAAEQAATLLEAHAAAMTASLA